MAGRKYSDAVVADAVARRERGESWRAIAAATGMSQGAAQYHCLAHGVLPTDAAQMGLTRTRVVRRGDHQVRLFTPAEDVRVVAMRLNGASIAQIARAIGRNPVSVRCRLQALARRDEAAEAAA